MKPEDIKRIAEIIGVDCNIAHDDRVFLKALYSDVYDESFRPDTNWAHTGMLLEWLHGKVDLRLSFNGYSHSVFRRSYPVPIFIGEGETLQLAICNAVLSVGEEVK